MSDPVLSIEKRIKCSRCQASGKIQSSKPGPDFTDCPTCLGEGYVITYEPVSEAELDDAVALGMELADLRRAKETAILAATKMKALFLSIEANTRADMGEEPLAKMIISLTSRGVEQACALITLLEDGGAQ